MDLNQIAVFVQVVRDGSFTAAARSLEVPKATVSRKVAALEAALGIRLLHRTTRSISLTDAGRRYFAQCRDGVAALEAANRQAAGEQDVPTGVIRISTPAEEHFLSAIIGAFLDRYPQVGAEVMLTDERLDLVAERIDVALRGGRLDDSSLIARQLASGRTILVAAPAYLEHAGEPAAPADLERHDCLVHGKSGDHAVWALRGPGGERRQAVGGRLAATSLGFLLRVAVGGLGIALLPDTFVDPEIRAGRLKSV